MNRSYLLLACACETLVDVARTYGVDPTTIGRLQQ
jgi:hypothetical protein